MLGVSALLLGVGVLAPGIGAGGRGALIGFGVLTLFLGTALVSPRLAARTTATIPRARLLMLPGVGHVAQIEAPDIVARAVAALWEAGDGWEDA